MLFWILCFLSLAMPLLLVNRWYKTDDKGRYLPEARAQSMELPVVLVILFCMGACFLGGWAFFSKEIQSIGYPIGMFVSGLILMIYPVAILRGTRLEGKEIDMWDHLKVRQEVMFPWEYRPTAVFLAIVYFLCGLMVFTMSTFLLLTIKDFESDWVLRGVTAAVLITGLYICYLMFKQPKQQ